MYCRLHLFDFIRSMSAVVNRSVGLTVQVSLAQHLSQRPCHYKQSVRVYAARGPRACMKAHISLLCRLHLMLTDYRCFHGKIPDEQGIGVAQPDQIGTELWLLSTDAL